MSSNGKIADSKSVNEGSIPSIRAKSGCWAMVARLFWVQDIWRFDSAHPDETNAVVAKWQTHYLEVVAGCKPRGGSSPLNSTETGS